MYVNVKTKVLQVERSLFFIFCTASVVRGLSGRKLFKQHFGEPGWGSDTSWGEGGHMQARQVWACQRGGLKFASAAAKT
jgi:hypothetical protein